MRHGSLWKRKQKDKGVGEMSDKKWTKEQLDAIYTSSAKNEKKRNVLVNAAAGSGKTAVLVERIIKKLIPSDENPNPTDIDRLLVVTFTNAAAAEMKERISDALLKNLEEAQKNNDTLLIRHLKRQESLLYNADITTIDAFCIKMLREHFHVLGIDPNFLIADAGQLVLMSEEAMEELFEECYEENNQDFLLLCDMFSDGRDDEGVSEIIRSVYSFTRALPNPSEWLLKKAEMFLMEEGEKNPWIVFLLEKKNSLCKEAIMQYEKALIYMIKHSIGKFDDLEEVLKNNLPCEENILQFNWGNHYEIVYNEYFAAKKLLEKSWNESMNFLEGFVFERLNKALVVRDKEKEIKDADAKAYIKALRDEGKKIMQKASEIFGDSLENVSCQMKNSVYPAARALVNITNLYEKSFASQKEKKNVLDFADVEQLCYRLFAENDEICSQMREKYDEILMDEYQDSNSLQEEIFNCISRGDNMFMVGDMKQSIYRFRRSDPTIFKEKSDSYKTRKNAKNRKIILSMNFRSRREVLESVNAVFEKIMSEDAGDIDYNKEQSLNNGNTTYEDKNLNKCRGYMSECYLLESGTDDEENIDKLEIEARFISKRIAQLKKEGFMVRDGDGYRKIENRDITILMSSHKYAADVYVAALNRNGIECFAESKGYFEKNEIRMVLSLIKIIQNPYQDIPLLGVLRSPVGGFSDDELVRIRCKEKGYIFSALKEYSKQDDELGQKCSLFIEKLEKWRNYTKYMSCDKLIWTLYEETGIYAFAGAIYGGEEAKANLRLLFERAKQYESSGYKGLFHFIRYIERLKSRAEDLSSAKLVGEGHNVVKIMTIHKSKGLEFPVVFLAGCGKKFFQKGEKIPMHNELGFGIDNIDTQKNCRISSVSKAAVVGINEKENISEEERKLYVAMTRAKEKLIVTGVVGDSRGESIEKKEKLWDKILSDGKKKMSPADVLKAVGFIDWVAPIARKRKDVWYYEAVAYSQHPIDLEEEEIPLKKAPEIKISDFEYPYKSLSELPTKISVTELKMSQGKLNILKRDAEMAQMPEFLQEKNLTGAKKGTIIHFIMQKLLPKEDMDEEYIKKCIEKLVLEGEITKEEADVAEEKKILKFYKSDIGMRILKSKNVMREATFETLIPLSMLDGYNMSEESILLQGIIDCYFEEDDGIVLLDYKSDYYKNPDELVGKYKSQLNWYAYALEKITKKKVKDKFIYMFYNDDIARVE